LAATQSNASPGGALPPDPAPAGITRRLAAALYDLLLVAGIVMATSFALIIARGGRAVPVGHPGYQLFLFGQAAAFFILFWHRGGQTLGMRTWRIRVESRRGEPLTVRVAAWRFATALLSLAAFGMGFLWMLFDPLRRTWHDRLSGTRVVLVRRSPD
jgi:uncharacterized RDD family membrane protein YckC